MPDAARARAYADNRTQHPDPPTSFLQCEVQTHLDPPFVIGYLVERRETSALRAHGGPLGKRNVVFGMPPRSGNNVSPLLPKFAPTLALLALAVASSQMSCQHSAKSPSQTREPRAQKWLDRAKASFGAADIDEASDSINEALKFLPNDPELKLVAANVAIAKLDFARTITLTEGNATSEALGLRSRAFWYQGDVNAAGEAMDALLRDPDVHDGWARSVFPLAHQGSGRKPYSTSGSIVAAVEMPRIRGTSFVVPIEIDGDPCLAMIASATAEVVLDKAQRREAAWVSIRIADRVTFHDVPAVTQDLSGISKQLNAPIKALLGVHFLRHANPTIDFMAHQFVVRRFEPPRPPNSTDLPVVYVRGGGMVVRSTLRQEAAGMPSPLLVDTSLAAPVALDADGWKSAGVNPQTLRLMPGETKTKEGVVPMLRFGSFDLPQVRGVLGTEVGDFEKALGINIDGIVGSGLLAGFRMTLGDKGRALWLEEEIAATSEAPASGAAPAPSSDAPTAPRTTAPPAPTSPEGRPSAPTPQRKSTGKNPRIAE